MTPAQREPERACWYGCYTMYYIPETMDEPSASVAPTILTSARIVVGDSSSCMPNDAAQWQGKWCNASAGAQQPPTAALPTYMTRSKKRWDIKDVLSVSFSCL